MNGLYLIKPTSIVSTGTGNSSSISTNGSVTFSTCATLSLNGVFSADYDNYMIVIRNSTTANQRFDIRFRASGTDNSTASSYVNQYWFANGTSVSASRDTLTTGYFAGRGDTQRAGSIGYVYGPYLVQPTAWRSIFADDYLNASVADYAGTHNQSTSYDGISFIATSGSFTGLVCVYGMVK